MKKITLITMQLKTPGGIERFISTLATMFSSDSLVEIVVNYGKQTGQTAFPIPSNVKVTFLTPNQPKEVSMKNILTSLHWHKIPSEIKRRYNIKKEQNKVFRKYFKALDTDIIITDRAVYNSLVNKHYKGSAKKIATDHNFHQNNKKYIKELVRSLKNFNSLVVATDELKEFYQDKILPTKCYSIPNPLPNIPVKKSPLNTKNIISVGRLVPEKDFPLLINIMKIIHEKSPDIHLTIIGDGKERKYLESQIRALNMENVITIAGWLPQEKIAKYYYNSSLFVLTSKTEAFGLVLTEAMSYGLPCLALSRASGARSQVTDKTGILLETDNPTIIANKIIDVLSTPSILKKYQSNISCIINSYSIDNTKKLWSKIL